MSGTKSSGYRNFIGAFTDLARLPKALWWVIGAFVIDTAAYYGVLTLMTTFLHVDLGWTDQRASITVSFFTMLVTILMLGVGGYAEQFGTRRAILGGLALTAFGRAIYTLATGGASPAMTSLIIVLGLAVTAAGVSILQPVCYSGVKQYTDAKTNSMGYGLIYALMNLGIVGMGALSSWLRPGVQDTKVGTPPNGFSQHFFDFFARFSVSGVQAVNWSCVGLTVIALLSFDVLMTRRAEKQKLRPDNSAESGTKPIGGVQQRLRTFFAGGPFSNTRFIFFIFMLLPVRTLFAHQWLTFPTYILRSYDKSVGDHMEQLIFWINSGIVFFGVPIATALTRHIHVYTMMIIGTLVSAVPAFLLCAGPDVRLLITYFVIFSIGEALWSARFMEYASEMAPPGRVAQYMGMAQIPWLLAKGTTGLYSGYVLARFCPERVPREQMHTGIMWFLYGCIAILTPIGLLLARKWAMQASEKPKRANTL